MKSKKIKADIMKGEYFYALGEDGQRYRVEGMPPKKDIVVLKNVQGIATSEWVQCGSRSETEERKFKPNKPSNT